jgi:hypothetical protein
MCWMENIDEVFSSQFLNTVEKACEFAFSHPTQQMDTTRGTLFGAYNAISGYMQNIKQYKIGGSEIKINPISATVLPKHNPPFSFAKSLKSTGETLLALN